VDFFHELRDAAMFDEHTGFQLVAHNDRRRHCHAFALTAEPAQHRHIIDFGQDDWPDARLSRTEKREGHFWQCRLD